MQQSLPALKQVGWGNGVKCDAGNSVLLESSSLSCFIWGEFLHLYFALTTSLINYLITEILEQNQLPFS